MYHAPLYRLNLCRTQPLELAPCLLQLGMLSTTRSKEQPFVRGSAGAADVSLGPHQVSIFDATGASAAAHDDIRRLPTPCVRRCLFGMWLVEVRKRNVDYHTKSFDCASMV